MSIESSTLKFSGHQTFPLRYGWIYKIIQEVKAGRSISSKEMIDKQMVYMGVGKNMVLSIRHWIKTLGLVTSSKEQAQDFELTPLAEKLFVGTKEEPAYDEFMDKVGTVWLIHWLSQSISPSKFELNTPRWFFNFYNGVRCDKQQIAADINAALEQGGREVTEATLKKDIDCFLQTYSVKSSSKGSKVNEDSFTSPFTELGLLEQVDAKSYVAELSTRKSLPVEVFAYALIDFIKKKHNVKVDSQERTFSFDSLLKDVGSPGKVFRLTEQGLSEKLDELQKLSEGMLAWTDTQGLRQLRHEFEDISTVSPEMYLESYYKKRDK
ncbi:DUF4007 family protein [Vibrio sp. JC009]|uniref:DUF4007 family protein n=1 Tax=Vibrio sp. JC009 TaxID=2912314 RepID=UPI0023B1A046|nr:DUF4007 family protein [Vibrio sp. JC009]WED22809.1 DUF4007 family protein [Vibrio sp. JC009]